MIRPHLRFLLVRPIMKVIRLAEISVVSMWLVIGMYLPATGQLSISSSIYPESLTVGDKFLYVNTVHKLPGKDIKPNPLGEQLGEAEVIAGIRQIPESPEGTISYACSLAVYKSGEIEIPSFTFAITDSSGKTGVISGDSLKVQVRTVLPADTTGLDIADIRGPYRLRGPIWPYIAIPIGVILLAYSAYRAYRRFKGVPEIPQAPPRPPWEIAFEMLDSLRDKRHYQYGRVKQFYFELSLIARGYIEGRYDFPAVERTTYELEYDERLKAVGENHYGRLFQFFKRADMAKFAKEIPSRMDADSDIQFIYDFVRQTIPVPEEPAKENLQIVETKA